MVSTEASPGGTLTTRSVYAHDKDYYFEDGSIVVLVEGSLFKVKNLQLTF
jgi:hypothetical protein